MKSAHPLIRYVASLGSVIACYLGYQTLIVPHIDGEQTAVQTNRGFSTDHTDPKKDIAQLFPPHAWELKPCNVLETEQGKLLYQKHERLEDGRVKITPLTLVVKQDKPEAQPFVIQAEDGAILKFDKPFSFSGGLGRIERGILLGKVRIYRISNAIDNDDSIDLVTESVELSTDRIHTLSDVAFRFGGSSGQGRHLTIDLFEKKPGGHESDFPVRKLELAHVHKIRIHRGATRRRNVLDPLDSANQGAFKTESQLAGTVKQPAHPLGSIDITCGGGFQLDLEHLVCSFKKDVRVISVDGLNALHCDELWLYFHKRTEPPESAAGNMTSEVKADFQIQKIVAIGQPARLFSKARAGYAEAEHLQMDLDTNLVLLRGKQPVQIRRETQTIVARELEYLINDDGSLGDTTALGPGTISQEQTRLVGADGKSEIDDAGFQCDWQGRLTVRDDGDKKLVEFESRTVVQIDGESRLAGDRIRFWLWEVAKGNPGELADDGTDRKQNFQLAPHKLIASGNVAIDSASLTGNTDELTVVWPAPSLTTIARWETDRTRTPRNFPMQTRGRVFVSKPILIRSRTAEDLPNETPRAKYRFRGDSVEITMADELLVTENGSKYRLAELTAVGDVSISQENDRGELDALEIRGQSLKAVNLGEKLYRLSIAGSDSVWATASGRGVKLSGPTINLDQQYNRLWIDGAGEMSIESKKQDDPAKLDSQAKRPQQTDMFWDGGMVFDGQTFYVEGNVRTLTERRDEDKTTDIETSSQALNAKLDRAISFKQQNGAADIKAELEKIILAGEISPSTQVFQNVSATSEQFTAPNNLVSVLLNHRNMRGDLIGAQEIAVPDAIIDSKTGAVSCAGPGIVQGIQLAKDRRKNEPSSPGIAGSRSNKPLEYIQVKFDRALEGNLNTNEMTFIHNVRLIYSPADDWTANFDADQRRVQEPNAMRLVCDRMQVFQWQPRSSTEASIEMIASGNAKATGQRFEATANRIGYNQANQTIRLESGARRDAELFYRDAAEGKQGRLTAETVLYNIETSAIQVDRYKEFDVNTKSPVLNRKK